MRTVLGLVGCIQRSLKIVLAIVFLWFGTEGISFGEIKVVVSNIEWFPGTTPNPKPKQELKHMQVARQELRRMNPDIFIGVEIRDLKSFRELVSAVPGLKPAVISRFKENGEVTRQQIAIASRYPVNSAWYEEWQTTKLPMLRRGFTFAAIEDPREWGKLLFVYGVHFKSNRVLDGYTDQDNWEARNEAARQLIQHFERMLNIYGREQVSGAVIGGDFNTNHDGQFGDRAIAILEEAGFYNTFSEVPKHDRITWKGRGAFSGTTFDYIMTYGLGKLRARAIPTSIDYSDHNAVELLIP
ncbi:MAG: endonuclease/exonuclease/phosphatase family protein [Methylacidiphilales bacterium]|nr:endonuclease/exonuclease/phosphatase family protein [Candidatus Methylacidiphilales bacterium]